MAEGTLGNIESQKYLLFHPIFNSFGMATGDIKKNVAWKSKGLSSESLKPPSAHGNSLAQKLKLIHNSKIGVEFKGGCLKQDKAAFTYKNVINLFTIYEFYTWSRDF